MFLERDLDILYEECLQCSWRREIIDFTKMVNRLPEGEKSPLGERESRILSPLG
jgi:hypothetical protein